MNKRSLDKLAHAPLPCDEIDAAGDFDAKCGVTRRNYTMQVGKCKGVKRRWPAIRVLAQELRGVTR